MKTTTVILIMILAMGGIYYYFSENEKANTSIPDPNIPVGTCDEQKEAEIQRLIKECYDTNNYGQGLPANKTARDIAIWVFNEGVRSGGYAGRCWAS